MFPALKLIDKASSPLAHRRRQHVAVFALDIRKRYDELDAERAALMPRLRMLGENGQYIRATSARSICSTIRSAKSKLAQPLAVLSAAARLIDMLEQVTAVARAKRHFRFGGFPPATVFAIVAATGNVNSGLR